MLLRIHAKLQRCSRSKGNDEKLRPTVSDEFSYFSLLNPNVDLASDC